MSGWDRVLGVALVAEFAVMCGCFGAMAQERPRSAFPCGGETVARGVTAGRLIDGRTFVLADGREVRLAAIEVPALSPSPGTVPSPGITARDALASTLGSAGSCSSRRNRSRPTVTGASSLMPLPRVTEWNARHRPT
jgi:hypothetical protein